MTMNLDHYWMPFTANRQYKANPRLMVSAKDMHYTSEDGRSILDGTAGLWCVNAGHCRAPIVEAIQEMAGRLDYSPAFQMGSPVVFEAAEKLANLLPAGLDRVFFTNSGSESVETALKMALAYHRARGDSAKTKLIGRERGYHGVNFGGISVGGIGANRKSFSASLLPGVDHLPHTFNLEHAAFSEGQPEWGAHLADALESKVLLHDPSTIAAVIVEPMAGSTGVLIPPQGYLERLSAICKKYNILLIFDEVITGFGRLGTPFAADRFQVTPDIMTMAKGMNNGSVPMGAVACSLDIYNTVIDAAPENAIEFFHGYTYSGHVLAAAATCATLDLYQQENTFAKAAQNEALFQQSAHALKAHPNVKDIRNLGIVAAVELNARDGKVGARGFEIYKRCWENGLLVRATGDIIAVSPPLIISGDQISELFSILGQAIKDTA